LVAVISPPRHTSALACPSIQNEAGVWESEISMRKMLSVTVWMGMAAVIVLAGATQARADEPVIATVPFDFIVGNVRFPAGHYEVTETSQPGVAAIESADLRHFTFFLTIPDSLEKNAATPELVFDTFGSEHFLARIDTPDGEVRDIPLTPAGMERELTLVEPHQRAAR
jgi:hypothetical protein